jgi:hypothetical protein
MAEFNLEQQFSGSTSSIRQSVLVGIILRGERSASSNESPS